MPQVQAVAVPSRQRCNYRPVLDMQASTMNYPEHNPALAVVAFDFDGVIASNTWPRPDFGTLDQDAAAAMIHYFGLGCEIVVFTARPDEHLKEIREWLRQLSLSHIVYEVTNRKPRACLYFDDRAVRWPLGEV